MKKAICIFLSVLILTALFSGCAREKEPLRVLVDADAREFSQDSCKAAMEELMLILAGEGGPSDVVLEVLPDYGKERETALARIRTEIMAGEGPDVFIVRSDRGLNSRDVLFPIPEKAMKAGLFLPLDKYIDHARFMEWDKHTKVIMDAGRDAYGQQIIPMVYTMPLTFYRASDIPDVKPGAETTWQDMLEDESGVLAAAATWRHRGLEEYLFEDSDDHYLEYILGDLADFESDTLLFTEEELLQRMTEVLETEDAYKAGKIAEVPAHYQTRMTVGYDYHYSSAEEMSVDTRSWGADSYRGIKSGEDQTMIPIYSDDGGVTATISAFAAVNANTKRPEDAFLIIDFLMDLKWQQKLQLYGIYFCGGAAGIPVHEDLMQSAYPVYNPFKFYITNGNYQEYSRVREQITRVYFRGDLTDAFDDLYWACRSAYDRGEDLAPIVSEHYTSLKMRMAE